MDKINTVTMIPTSMPMCDYVFKYMMKQKLIFRKTEMSWL